MATDNTNDLKSQSHEGEKDYLDPETAYMVGTTGLWVLQSMAQAVFGWIGIQLFKRLWDKIRGWFGRKNDQGKGTSQKISEEESAAASFRSLRGGCDGGRVFQGESQSDQS